MLEDQETRLYEKGDLDTLPESAVPPATDGGGEAAREPAGEQGSAGVEPPSRPREPSDDAAAIDRPARVETGAGKSSGARIAVIAILALLIVGAGIAVYFALFADGAAEGRGDEIGRGGDRAVASAKPTAPSGDLAASSSTDEEGDEKRTAKAIVDSKPSGAKVLVAGVERGGVTPLVLEDLVEGEEVEVETRLFGWIPAKTTLTPIGDEVVSTALEMKRAKIEIELISTPPGAIVTAGGEWLGKTPRTITRKQVEPGFEYEMKRFGYKKISETVSESEWSYADGTYSLTLEKTLVAVEKKRPEPGPQPKALPTSAPEPAPAAKPENGAASAPSPESALAPEPAPSPEPAPAPEPEPEPEPPQVLKKTPY